MNFASKTKLCGHWLLLKFPLNFNGIITIELKLSYLYKH